MQKLIITIWKIMLKIKNLHIINIDSEIQNLHEYHDLYLTCDTLLFLTDVFENIRKMYLEIYQLDSARTFSALGSA